MRSRHRFQAAWGIGSDGREVSVALTFVGGCHRRLGSGVLRCASTFVLSLGADVLITEQLSAPFTLLFASEEDGEGRRRAECCVASTRSERA